MYIPDTPMQYAPSFQALAKVFEFEEFVNLYLICNSSAAAPFHNFQGAQWAVEDTFRYYSSITLGHFVPSEVRTLLISALFKDVNHGAGRCGDETNITNAILTLQEINSLAHTPLTVAERKLSSALISSTLFTPSPLSPRFPSVITSDMEKALRDADLSLVFRAFDPRGRAQIVGFLEETNLGFALGGHTPLTLSESVTKTGEFLMGARFNTPLGCKTRDQHLKKCLERLERFSQEWTTGRIPRETIL